MEYLNNSFEPYEKLCNAVVLQTVKDYASALRIHKLYPNDIQAQRTITDCEQFFTKDISLYSDEDGEVIMDIVKKNLDDIDVTRLLV